MGPKAVIRSLATLLIVGSLTGASSAYAASISGSGADPADAPSGKPDLERLSIGYDDSEGVITATFTLYPRYWQTPSLYLRFGLSKPGQGGCLSNADEPDLNFRAAGDFESGVGIWGYADLNARTGSTERVWAGPAAEGNFTFSYTLPGVMEGDDGYVRAPPAVELVRAGYRCVSQVFADSDPYVEDGDQIARFCLGSNDCVEQAPPPRPPQQQPPAQQPPQQPPAANSGSTVPPSPVVVVVPGQPSVVTTPESTPRQRSITRAQAHYQTRLALRRFYKKAFANGSRYRATCRRIAATKQMCRVSWRYRKYGYRGKVTVKRLASGYSTRVDIDRYRR